jgi:ArsR family transcriptional regulator, arsenate/arsenite/antimonite-responsive transcriptional repressor
MPQSKAHLFGREEVEIARVAKIFSHPARIAILRTLARRKECLCGEIVDILPLAQATVSQHLKELKSAGLISGEVDGPRSCYCLDRKALREALDVLQVSVKTFLREP